MIASTSAQRFLIWSSIILAVIFSVGYMGLTGLFPPPTPNKSAEYVAHLYGDHNIRTRIGIAICLFAGGFNAPWTAAVAIQMARLEKGAPVWAITQAMGGALSTILFPLPAIFWGAAAFSIGRAPELTLMMHELAFLTFVTPTSFFWVQALPIAVICFISKPDQLNPFPRWVGYLTVWLLAAAELGVLAQLFHVGPFAWNGLFTFWIPLSLFGMWLTVIDISMLRAITRQHAAGYSRQMPG